MPARKCSVGLSAFAYRSWTNSTGQRLFRPGIPGGGKTTLTSLVDDLNNRCHDDPETGVAYLYCDFKSFKGERLMNISIKKQFHDLCQRAYIKLVTSDSPSEADEKTGRNEQAWCYWRLGT